MLSKRQNSISTTLLNGTHPPNGRLTEPGLRPTTSIENTFEVKKKNVASKEGRVPEFFADFQIFDFFTVCFGEIFINRFAEFYAFILISFPHSLTRISRPLFRRICRRVFRRMFQFFVCLNFHILFLQAPSRARRSATRA